MRGGTEGTPTEPATEHRIATGRLTLAVLLVGTAALAFCWSRTESAVLAGTVQDPPAGAGSALSGTQVPGWGFIDRAHGAGRARPVRRELQQGRRQQRLGDRAQRVHSSAGEGGLGPCLRLQRPMRHGAGGDDRFVANITANSVTKLAMRSSKS